MRAVFSRILPLFCSAIFFLHDIVAAEKEVFTFDSLRAMAFELAHKPYIPPSRDLPESLKNLTYDSYRSISYRRNKALWGRTDQPFRIELFHRGYIYQDQVELYLLDEGKVTPLRVDPNLFWYARGTPQGLKSDLGAAGFRILYDAKERGRLEELVSFLGASYFRAVAIGGVYGSAARGLAVDTIVPGKSEEFPLFRSFWLLVPKKGEDSLTIYALLDSPSVSGAYQFNIHVGAETIIDVEEHLFLRKSIEALGIAPITSMFFYGKEVGRSPAVRDPTRPEVHDADGLLLQASAEEWIWRPLHNDEKLLLSSFVVSPDFHGFGLLQRERDEKRYRDTGALPERRSTIFVERLTSWPKGRVELMELPSKEEGMDNIVAQYLLDSPRRAGEEISLRYRLRFYSIEKPLHPYAKVMESFRVEQPDRTLLYQINFSRKELPQRSKVGELQPNVTTRGGMIKELQLFPLNDEFYRLQFRLDPLNEPSPIELRASLYFQGKLVSEIWSDQWRP